LKKENYLYVCGLGLFFFLAGCVNLAKASDHDRQPAQTTKSDSQRVFVDSPACQFGPPQISDKGVVVTKQSALSGFFVGPNAPMMSLSPDLPTLRPFYTDGCSMSPDGDPLNKGKSEVWVDCCIKHDTMYWLGGSTQDKAAADAFLEKCIADSGYPEIGKVYKIFVGKFGGPDSNKTYRWGYGWNYKRPYADVTAAEEAQVKVMYGVGKDKIQSVLYDANPPIVRMCDTNDPVFVGFSPEEKIAYAMLNAKIRKNTMIEWARWDSATSEQRVFEVGLQNCATPVVITFYSNANQSPQITDSCD